MADVMLMVQENSLSNGPSGEGVVGGKSKRYMKNCPSSASKRQALLSIGNIQQQPLLGGGGRGGEFKGKRQEEMEEVCLPRHLDPLYCLPSSIPSHIPSLSRSSSSFTSFPSPASSPMLVSTPHSEEMMSFIEFNVDDLSCQYVEEIFAHLRQTETIHHPVIGYMSLQPDITNAMRAILVDWLVEVCDEFHLLPDTLFAAVCFVDRYLSMSSVPRSKLQLVGVTSLYIAAKLEEIYPPELSEFAYITDDTYTKRQIVKMEQELLNVLRYNLVQPTTFTFLQRYLKLSSSPHSPSSSSLDEQVEMLSKYLCELALQDGDPFIKYYPSLLSACAVCLSRHILGLNPWPLQLQYYSGYTVSIMSHCLQDLHRTHALSHCHPQQAIRQKYNSEKLLRVAYLQSPETLPF